ncbi:MAG: tryptophan synthase subunit alpha [Candidatus Omnitrophota bacterium]
MNIKQKFEQLKKEGRKAFIAYVPFGFPTIARSKDIILTLQGAGVDIIELGIPFSDPVADGAIIQAASIHALNGGANTENLFAALRSLQKSLYVPVALMTYYNPIFRFGVEKFFTTLRGVGVTGLITVDLPADESRDYIRFARESAIETIFLVTPVTSHERARYIARASRGFVYYVSVAGTTGPQNITMLPLARHIQKLKSLTRLPMCVGFGIHSAAQVRAISAISDGVIVGSSIVNFIARRYAHPMFLKKLKAYIQGLRRPSPSNAWGRAKQNF